MVEMSKSDAAARLSYIFETQLGEGEMAHLLAQVVEAALAGAGISVAMVKDLAGENFAAVLQAAWSWRILVPRRSSGCAEWDYLVFSLDPGDWYAMPHFSRHLVLIARRTGRLDARQALLDLYREMGEPEWERIPEICIRLAGNAVHGVVTGAQIQAACAQAGLKNKTGALIAVLKGGGVISPKLADKAAAGFSRSPRYELHPCLLLLTP